MVRPPADRVVRPEESKGMGARSAPMLDRSVLAARPGGSRYSWESAHQVKSQPPVSTRTTMVTTAALEMKSALPRLRLRCCVAEEVVVG